MNNTYDACFDMIYHMQTCKKQPRNLAENWKEKALCIADATCIAFILAVSKWQPKCTQPTCRPIT